MKAAVSILALLVLAPLTQAAPQNVQADLLADVSVIKPGQSFTVGVLLKIQPKWHVYWKNPGDSGRATTVKFDLPPGFTAGDLRYPIPTKIVQPGDETIYGYEDEVMFTATITPPKDLSAGASVHLGANVQWLVCADVCIPGKATANLSLPVSSEAAPDNQDLFKTWSDRMPRTVADAGDIAKFTAHVLSGGGRQSMEFNFNQPVQNADWYPDASDDLNVTSIHATADAGGRDLTIDFNAVPLPGASATPTIPGGLLVYTDSNGQRHGVTVSLGHSPSTRPIGD